MKECVRCGCPTGDQVKDEAGEKYSLCEECQGKVKE